MLRTLTGALATLCVAAAHAQPPAMAAERLTTPPLLDGQVDNDPAWDNVRATVGVNQ